MTDLQALDVHIFRAIHLGLRSVPADLFFALLSTSVLGWLQFLFGLGLIYPQRTRRYAGPHLIATALCLTAPLFKTWVDHDRPSQMNWVVEQETFYTRSFPSGHTTVGFAVAATWIFMLRREGKGRWEVPLLLWAILAGMSRIYRGVHWPTDVLGGALLGILIASLVHFAWPLREDPPTLEGDSEAKESPG